MVLEMREMIGFINGFELEGEEDGGIKGDV